MELNEKQIAIKECFELTMQRALEADKERARDAAYIQASARTVARAYLEGTKLFSVSEVDMIVDTIKISESVKPTT